jgi:hypothetical protein
VGVVARSLRWGGLFVLASLVPGLAACDGPPPKPAAFNNRIAVNTAKWSTAVAAFRKAIEPLSNNQDVSPAVAQNAYDQLTKEFKEVKSVSRHMPVPAGSSAGQAYRDKYWQFLDNQEDLLNNEVKRIVSTIADTKLKPYDKWRTILVIFGEIERKEQPARAALQKAQGEFNSAHKLNPQMPPSK